MMWQTALIIAISLFIGFFVGFSNGLNRGVRIGGEQMMKLIREEAAEDE